MKNKFAILVSAILLSSGTYAQKDELKALKKIYDKENLKDGDLTEYKTALSKAEAYLATASETDRIYINYFKSQAPLLELNMQMQKPENKGKEQMLIMKAMNTKTIADLAVTYSNTLDFEKKSGKQVYTSDIKEDVTTMSPMLMNYVIALGNQKNYKEAANVLNSIYLLDKSKPENLYYAANYAVSALDYDNALQYYDALKKMNYSGEGITYLAKSIASDKDETFPTKAERDKMVSFKTHVSPREEKIPSRRGEIYKNIALILVEKGRIEEAKTALADAKKENPDDTSILLSEADLYLSLKDTETYKKLIAQVVEKNPNDVDMIYNLGVLELQNESLAEAEKYFKRAIEINPNYNNAYINLSALKLKADKKLVDEINSLGTSEKDNKRYAALKKERDLVFRSALPYLEKAHELDSKNEDVAANLMSVYNYLEMKDKYQALKAASKK